MYALYSIQFRTIVEATSLHKFFICLFYPNPIANEGTHIWRLAGYRFNSTCRCGPLLCTARSEAIQLKNHNKLTWDAAGYEREQDGDGGGGCAM
jgi:hypothetical protein